MGGELAAARASSVLAVKKNNKQTKNKQHFFLLHLQNAAEMLILHKKTALHGSERLQEGSNLTQVCEEISSNSSSNNKMHVIR